jgi:threonine synthase
VSEDTPDESSDSPDEHAVHADRGASAHLSFDTADATDESVRVRTLGDRRPDRATDRLPGGVGRVVRSGASRSGFLHPTTHHQCVETRTPMAVATGSTDMETTEAFEGFTCTACGERFEADVHGQCPDCGGILDPTYDVAAADLLAGGDDANRSSARAVGRDRASLVAPLPFPDEALPTAGEGATPLVRTDRLAEELGVRAAFVKDEARNPTGTYVDRGMAVAVAAAATAGVEPLALAAAGNAGQSAAAYASRADLRSYAFVPSRTAFSNKALVNVHGGEMRVVGGRYDDAAAAVDEQLATDYYDLGAFETPYRHDGAKTLAYEVVADYARATDPDAFPPEESDTLPLSGPDALVVPVGTGELLVGVEHGLSELLTAGVLADPPAVYAVQAAGCAPVASAWETGADATEPWDAPDTIVGELEIPDPAGGDLALAALDEFDGAALSVSDDDALESAVTAAQTEVLEVGGSGGVALAGAWELADRGDLSSDDDVVVVNPDAGVKTPDVLRSHLMGKGI